MRANQCVSSLAVIAVMLVSPQALFAQVVRNDRAVVGSWADPLGTPRALPPYKAIRKTTFVEKLADGTTVTHESAVKEARDSQGRTYRETRLSPPAGAGDPASDRIVVHVVDPVSRTTTTWNTKTQDATIFHEPGPTRLRPAPADSSFGVALMEIVPMEKSGKAKGKSRKSVQPAPPVLPQENFEKLGAKTINGLKADGIRITRIIPAGAEGNERQLTVTKEQWFSPELGIAVLWIAEDPRLGTSTMELLDLDRSEPAMELFQVPDGYRVKEIYPRWRD